MVRTGQDLRDTLLFHSSHNIAWGLLESVSSSPAIIYWAGESGLIPLVLYSITAWLMFRWNEVRAGGMPAGRHWLFKN